MEMCVQSGKENKHNSLSLIMRTLLEGYEGRFTEMKIFLKKYQNVQK
jgi:hypothetical protein